MFSDKVKITVRSGKGGDGHISFRHEKFVPTGGPDGGDGGKGGSVILELDKRQNTLADYRYHKSFHAQDGENGNKRNCSGKDGSDIILRLPEGTVVKEAHSGKVITDLSGTQKRFVLLRGGRGGKGNQHYATSKMQAPKYAQPGEEAQELELILELKVIADVGLVGFPNVGKSTFLSRVTNARPKIADYHFTTLIPNLGVVELDEQNSFVIADIPGIIEGASQGLGLGYDFLRHIERTRVLIHIVDAAGVEGRDPIQDVYAIWSELEKYNPDIAKRPQVIAANKIDAIWDADRDPIQALKREFEPMGHTVYAISAVSGEGLTPLLYHVAKLLADTQEPMLIFRQEYFPSPEEDPGKDPYTVIYDKEAEEYVVEGPRIEKMLGYTNLESERGFAFFQKFLKETGILDELVELGIQDGNTVRMYGLSFDYYK
ncbi:MAG: GTPase ObgE [Lachnospiraceae bacterium]|jgi:GTP-binding protein|nr:GTPase ObgE [Lachnospiraceae bacterium]